MRVARIGILFTALLGPVVAMDALTAALPESLPFARPTELVVIRGTTQPRGAPDLLDWFGQARTLAGLTVLSSGRATTEGAGGIGQRVDVLVADHQALSVLGLSASSGRFFMKEDLAAGNTALLAPAFWKNRYGSQPVAGQHIVLNGRSYEIIGVAPTELSRFARFDVMLARTLGKLGRDGLGQGAFSGLVLGRRAKSAGLLDILTDVERLQRLREIGRAPSTVTTVSLHDALVGPLGPTLTSLAVAGALLFALALISASLCAATETSDRMQELSVRSALGADQWELQRESLRPWVTAAPPAILLTLLSLVPARRLISVAIPGLDAARGGYGLVLGTFVLLAFALCFGISLATRGLVVLAPGSLPGARPHGGAAPEGRLVTFLIAGQIAFCLSLACGSVVAALGFHRQIGRDIGFDTHNVFRANVDLGEGRQPNELSASWAQILSDPALKHGALATDVPWAPPMSSWLSLHGDQGGALVGVTHVGPHFFESLGLAIVAGSDPFRLGVASTDVVVSDSVAERLSLQIGSVVTLDGDPHRVAAVVKRVGRVADGTGAVPLQAYLGWDGAMTRSSAAFIWRGSPRDAQSAIRQLRADAPNAAVSDALALSAEFGRQLTRQRLGALSLSLYATIATLLLASGLHGTVARRVAQRTREIGVRMALGGRTHEIARAMLAPLSVALLGGTSVGLLGGFALSLFVSTSLVWAEPLAPISYAGSAVLVWIVCLGSAFLALHRVTRVQPANLLRHE